MNANQTAALIQAATARAMIRAMGMQAENDQRKALGDSMAYNESHFSSLIDDENIGSNSVISLIQQVTD